MTDQPRGVFQQDRPCEIHATHTPITVVNELHHIFPQEYQRELWGETRDERKVSVCATGHNTITQAWLYHRKNGSWPSYAVGKTRDVLELGWQRYLEAKASLTM